VSADAVTLRLVEGIRSVEAPAWDALVPDDDPFVRHGFLALLEDSGSVARKTGWRPLHAVAELDGRPVAAAPLYAKSHSWGEYVFDHGWADAYERAGGQYYPKLLIAVPFTPVPGPRLLGRDATARRLLATALAQLPLRTGLSSLHVNFCSAADRDALRAAGFLERAGVQYHWHNRGYRDFADFLDALKSPKRKMIRKERAAVRAAGVEIEIQHGAALDRHALARFYPFYLATVDKRWGNAYLTGSFFEGLADALPGRLVVVQARRHGRVIAAALNLLGGGVLYGRVWGALEEVPFLHFETCYYAAIEFAIGHGLARVEAGAQGQHKIARGYAPVATTSMHLLRDVGLRGAVERFLAHERAQIDLERAALAELLPYRDSC
jgi:predicted N-acyltransferase